jgi:hypothetical protein
MFFADEEGRNDARNASAVTKRRMSHAPHEPFFAAAEYEADASFSESPAERVRSFAEKRVGASA